MSNSTTLATERLVEIAIADLQDSPTNPRHGYDDDDSMVDFVNSIRKHGIIQPLVVRPLAKGYEIAAGHRRRYGARLAGLISVPCIVRTMSDEQVIDTHIVENVQRKDLEPVDEAKLYQLMRDRGTTLEQIAERAGRSEGYITRRLSLLNLIPSLQADIQAGTLPIEYGFELAKYPADAQAEAESELYGTKYVYNGKDVTEAYEAVECGDCNKITVFAGEELEDTAASVCSHCQSDNLEAFDGDLEVEEVPDRSEVMRSVAEIRRWFERSYVMSLAKAKFTMEDTRLREDGLACVNCPQRTGANAGLFGDTFEDFCLNKPCFNLKTFNIVQITRGEKAKELGIEPEALPVVQQFYYGETPMAGTIPSRDFVEVREAYVDEDGDEVEADETCEFVGPVFDVREMDVATGCLVATGCKVHHWQNRQSTGDSGGDGVETEEMKAAKAWKKLERKEEIWNVKVGEATRRKVLAEAAKAFGLRFGTHLSAVSIIDTVERMWTQEDYRIQNHIINPLLEEILGEKLPSFERTWNQEKQAYDEVGVTKAGFLGTLSAADLAAAFCLFTYGHKQAMLNGTWEDQHPIAELAERFDVNYQLIDAQVRVELSPKKYLKRHQAYLQQCETGDPDREAPVLFAVKAEEAKPEKKGSKKGSKKAEDATIPEPTAVTESVSDEKGTVEPSESYTPGQIIIGRPAGLDYEPDEEELYEGSGSGDELASIFADELRKAEAEEGE